MKNRPTRPPQSDAEWARNTEKRLRSLEDSQAIRVGEWVISDNQGKLVATKPGEALDVGQQPIDSIVADLTRGYVTPDDIKKVVVPPKPGEPAPLPPSAGPLQDAADWLTDRWHDFINFPGTVIGSIGGVLMDGAKTVGNFLTGLYTALTGDDFSDLKGVDDVNTAAGGVTTTTNTNSSNHLNLLGQLLYGPARVLGSIGNVVMDGLSTAQEFLTGLWFNLTGQTPPGDKKITDVNTAMGGVVNTTNTNATNHTNLLTQLLTNPGAVLGSIGAAVMDGVNTVGSFLTGLWNNLTGQNGANKNVTDVTTAMGGVVTTTNTNATNHTNLLTQLLTNPGAVLGSIGNAVMDGVNTVGSFLTGMWNNLTGQTGTNKSVTDVTTAAGSVTNTGNTNASNHTNLLGQLLAGPAQVIGSIGNVIMDGVSTVGNFLGGLWNNFTGQTAPAPVTVAQVHTAAGGVTNTTNTNAQNHTNLLGNLLAGPAQVIGSIGNVIMDGVNSVGSFLTGLWNGLTGQTGSNKKATDVASAASSVAFSANDGQTKALEAKTGNTQTNAAIYRGYFGEGANPNGTIAEVQETISTIKERITGGYTLQSLTYNADMTKQLIQIAGSPTGGTFTLTYGGQTTSALAYNATASQIQTALRALSGIGNNVTVTNVPAGYPYAVATSFFATFNGFTTPAPTAITATSSLTGGSSPAIYTNGVWTPPWASVAEAPRELYLVSFGSGQGGGCGQKVESNGYQTVQGGNGGIPGGYAALEIDATSLNPLYPVPYWIPPGGLGSTTIGANGNAGGESYFYLNPALSTTAGQYYVSNVLGYYTTNQSAPGGGGLGGWGYLYYNGAYYAGWYGDPGGSTLLANGGASGIGGAAAVSGPAVGGGGVTINYRGTISGVPANGTIGQTASLTGKSRAGGGGGGGGGGSYSYYYDWPGIGIINVPAAGPGGLGGNGGFPGGGGGGGGGSFRWNVSSSTGIPGFPNPGNGGNGANGVIILLWK